MRILLTGANGYIGSKLLPLLLDEGHTVYALLRSSKTLDLQAHYPNLYVIQADLLEPESLQNIPQDIDVAYYLVHGMSYGRKQFERIEEVAITTFIERLKQTHVKQIIFLSGLCSDENLSPHLASRYRTELYIKKSGLPYTILRAGIIIGEGSASFEIIRDLTEKIPVMIAPRWVENLCQPIAIQDALRYLKDVMLHQECFNQTFDIGGPDRLSYKQMLLKYAEVRKLRRHIFVVPVLTPRLSSYWLYFVTSVNFALASSLVDSVKNQAICMENRIKNIFPEPCLTYEESLVKTLDLIAQNPLIIGWKDTLISSDLEAKLNRLTSPPAFGCFIDKREIITGTSREVVLERVWNIGGDQGWYFFDWAWGLRGFIDKLVGGVGLQRGRTSAKVLQRGHSLDFWRVLLADKPKGHLLLYAEMKLPGEAWLEFKVEPYREKGCKLVQTAIFRPKGLWGRFYWYFLLPFHKIIFQGMAKEIAK